MINILFRISVTLGLIGMGLGIAMGIRQDFTLMPAHAHLNLIGFVTMFLSALYYRAVPEAAASGLARLQAVISIAGAFVFPVGLAGILIAGPGYFEPIVIGGALIVFTGMALFAFIVFRTNAFAKISTNANPLPHGIGATADMSR
ncbi:MAG: hypothetical protein ACXWKA_17240 [Xanthobacteraceae bacterium]